MSGKSAFTFMEKYLVPGKHLLTAENWRSYFVLERVLLIELNLYK